jgi:hypothetical protein
MQPVLLAVFGRQEASFKHAVKGEDSMMGRCYLIGARIDS